MATVSGYVERIKYRNEENGYSILDVSADGLDYVLVGTFPYISEGDFIEATGRNVEHPVYGDQIQVESYELKAPEDTASMERYLGSGAIRGVGTALAARIVRRFKADTFRIIEEEPERLAEVKGISEKMARAISEQMEAKKEMRQAMMFLQDYGISMNLALKIYNEYGTRMYGIIKEIRTVWQKISRESVLRWQTRSPRRSAFSQIRISASAAAFIIPSYSP